MCKALAAWTTGATLVGVLLGGAAVRAQPGSAPSLWQPGTSHRRQVTAAAPDLVRIPLAAGWFVRLEAMQSGGDLAVRFLGPSGELLMEVDSENGRYGPETVAAFTEVAGEYTLEVRLPGQPSASTEYALNLAELREATSADRDFVAATLDYAQGQGLNAMRTTEAARQAVSSFTRAYEFFSKSGDHDLSGLASYGLGNALRQVGDFRGTVRWFREAADAFRAAADQHMEAEALNSAGGALFVLGEPQESMRLYQQALVLFSALGDRGKEANLLSNLGLAEARLGQWQGAIDRYRRALALYREDGNRGQQGLVLNNLGSAYLDLGETDEALRLFEESLLVRRAVADRSGQAGTLSELARAHLARGEPEKALASSDEGLALRVALGDRRGEAAMLAVQAQALAALGRLEAAQSALVRSVELGRAAGNRRGASLSVLYLATTSHASGQAALAMDWAEQASQEFRALGDLRLEAMALETSARAASALGNLSLARSRMEESLRVSESARRGADSQQLRASFFATRQSGYSFYVDLLMRIGGLDALALESSERSRARSLMEMLAASSTAIREGVDVTLLQREHEVSDRLNAKGALLLPLGPDTPRALELTQEIHALELEYQEVQAAIRKSSPRYAAVTQPSVLTTAQIQSSVLDRDTLLLEYALGEERSYLWVLSKDSLKTFQLPSRTIIEAQANRVSQLVATRAPAQRINAAAAELSRVVFGDAGPSLTDKRLLIVPDGALQSVPFAMLPEPGTEDPMIVRHEIVMTPSASALAALRTQVTGRTPAPKMLAVFADPVFDGSDPRVRGGASSATTPAPELTLEAARLLEHVSTKSSASGSGAASAGVSTLRIPRLPYTAQEAEQILRVAPNASNLRAIGFEANRATAIGGRLSDYRYLHFATHGYLDTERPELSALVLSQVDSRNQPEDGFLRVNDIYNARLSADLVVLSACETGLGKEVRGEGLMGLTRAFLYAGVPKVVVSLWSVNDRATSELMVRFYEQMLRRGKTPSAALREAQLELRKQKRWESPFYWAAFVQQGDWQ